MFAVVKWVVTLAVAGLIGAGGWLSYQFYYAHEIELRDKNEELAAAALQIQGLEVTVAEKDQEIERLDLALRMLKVDRRRAQIMVVGQSGTEESGGRKTRFRFVEIDEDSQSLGPPREFEIDGDVLYVDAWVVKFEDFPVEQGDPLGASSVCIFRRVFGEHQKPSEGFEIDRPGERPRAYGSDEPGGAEGGLWEDFWELAHDPEKAEQMGVRAAHGEAPSMQLRPGEVYTITLRSSGGLTFSPERLPAVIDE